MPNLFADPLTLVMLAVLAVLIFFMFRNSRKRQRDAAAMQDRTQVGAKIMTNFGLFGTIVAINDEENEVQVESTPGTIVTVHRQTIAKIITAPGEVVTDDEAELAEEGVLLADEPEYGQRKDSLDAGDRTADGRAASNSQKAAE
ncbi:preprotein translocase subunit YajC [Naasia lichenicola]|uniref:Preprotein translocase subunit YajC n=1 Tax=Naasia lichenicola TaxID=2565933 RepID=A0A4S4FR07_9MICO|nr:preprotein translocase subunit YajC [Naasia lichenicola]THG33030.1 preprotein translocase subunit YajC [Naasia lichenicola]